MANSLAFWKCWMDSDTDEDTEQLKAQLLETKNKLEQSRKEIDRLKLERISLINASFHSGEPSNMNFDYSDSTVIIRDSIDLGKQTSAFEKLEEKVAEKLQKKTGLNYRLLEETENASMSETEEIAESTQKHTPHNSSLMAQIHKLSQIIQETESDKNAVIEAKNNKIAALKKQALQCENEHSMVIDSKNKEIASLKRQVNALKSKTMELAMLKNSDSFSHNIHSSERHNISKVYSSETESDSDVSRPHSTEKMNKTAKNHYDHCSEQIEILNDEMLKSKAVMLCMEEMSINQTGQDQGLILFFEKYLKSKTIEQILRKSGGQQLQTSDVLSVSNATALVNVLSFVTILYKVKVFHVRNGTNKRPKIDNSEIKSCVKYLAIWIVRTYGQKSGETYYDNKREREYDIYDFEISKDEFETCMCQYLQAFVAQKGTHIDSQLL